MGQVGGRRGEGTVRGAFTLHLSTTTAGDTATLPSLHTVMSLTRTQYNSPVDVHPSSIAIAKLEGIGLNHCLHRQTDRQTVVLVLWTRPLQVHPTHLWVQSIFVYLVQTEEQ